MDESGEYHSQQTDTRTENEIPHILTHRWVMNNENTWTQEGSTTHWGLLGGIGEGQSGGSWGKIMWGKMPDEGEGEEDSKTHCPVYLCNYLSCSPHVPQNLKCNKRKKKKRKIKVLRQKDLDQISNERNGERLIL